MNKQELIKLAIEVEEEAYSPSRGRGIDRSPYTYGSRISQIFLDNALIFFVGDSNIPKTTWIKQQVAKRYNAGEKSANQFCTNWWLWTLLNILEVSRERV